MATDTFTWSTQADWDAAQQREHLVSRAVGNRDPDTLQQGYDTNYAPFNSGLVLYLTFDESGAPVVDYSPNSNNATLNGGATFNEEGLLNSSGARVEGDGSYFEAADDPSWDTISEGITVVATYKPPTTGIGGSWNGLIGKGDTTWQMRRRNADDRVTFNVRDSAGNDIINGDSNSGLSSYDAGAYWTNGEWNQTVGSYSANAAIGKFYHNGTLYNTDASAGSTIGQNTQPVQIGANLSGTDYRRYWDGGIEEMMVFNRQLSDAEVEGIWDTLFNGMFLSDKKASDLEAKSMSFTTNIPTDTSLDITVYQDTTGDGIANNQQAFTLSGGSETVTLDQFEAATGADYWFQADFASINKRFSAQIQSVSLEADDIIGVASETVSHSASANTTTEDFGISGVSGSHGFTLDETADDTAISLEDVSESSSLSYSVTESGSSGEEVTYTHSISRSLDGATMASDSAAHSLLIARDVQGDGLVTESATASHIIDLTPSASETGVSTEQTNMSYTLVHSVNDTGINEEFVTASHSVEIAQSATSWATSSNVASHVIDLTESQTDWATGVNSASHSISRTAGSSALSKGYEQAQISVTTITEIVKAATAASDGASLTIAVTEESDARSSLQETAAITLSLNGSTDDILHRIQQTFHIIGSYDNIKDVTGIYMIIHHVDGNY